MAKHFEIPEHRKALVAGRLMRRLTTWGDGCWLLGRAGNFRGYGGVKITDRRKYAAHRVAYALVKGPIPAGMLVCHRCDTPRCVRPDHLFLGTASDNMRDMIAKGRDRFSKKRAAMFADATQRGAA